MWDSVSNISGIFSLAAFFAAALVTAYRASLQHKEKIISSADDEKAVKLAQAVLVSDVQVDTKKLARDQLYSLAKEKLQLQSQRLHLSLIHI